MSFNLNERLQTGLQHHRAGRLQDAEEAYRSILAEQPRQADALYLLGVLTLNSGRSADAVKLFEQAIDVQPAVPDFHNMRAEAYRATKDYDAAIAAFERAIEIAPNFPGTHNNLGNLLLERGRTEDALRHYRKTAELSPEVAMVHYNVGIALDALNRPEEAVASYERALAIEPNYAEAHHNMANALDELGRWDDAAEHYKKALAIKPDYAEAHRNLSRIRPDQAQIQAIEKLLQKPSLPDADVVHCHFALGRIHHDAGNHEQAFEHYRSGNTLKRKSIAYDADGFSDYVSRLIATFTPDYFERALPQGSTDELPVFVLGMPRSGTTLVEQIICSHPQAHGAGELVALGRYEVAIADKYGSSDPYPGCMRDCFEDVIREYAETYLEELRSYSGDAARVTDKMPNNFMRIGLIKTLFPRARIIHCARSALDTCTSNYLHYFATGNEFSFDLEELGRFYLDYERLMAHWNTLFPSGILNVQYEDLVDNQEAVSRQLIEYLGLDWDEQCLEFFNNERAVHNFSSIQVRQPVYRSSVERWKRYETQLEPLRSVLSAG